MVVEIREVHKLDGAIAKQIGIHLGNVLGKKHEDPRNVLTRMLRTYEASTAAGGWMRESPKDWKSSERGRT